MTGQIYTCVVVVRVIEMTLGKALQAQNGALNKLSLAQQHHAADIISRSREMFSEELGKMIDEQRGASERGATPGELGPAVITATNIKDMLERLQPQIKELLTGAGLGNGA